MLIAFPRQQWLGERVSVLFYTYIASLVWSYVHPGIKILLTFCYVTCASSYIQLRAFDELTQAHYTAYVRPVSCLTDVVEG